MRFAARAWGASAALVVVVVVLLATVAAVPSARAGVWAQVACVNPNGSAATSAGWSAFTSGIGEGAAASAACAPGTPMSAALGDTLPAPVFSTAGLQYTPPLGSVRRRNPVGGALRRRRRHRGGRRRRDRRPAQTRADARLRCTAGSRACGASATDYSGAFTVPRNLGGNLYVTAGCVGTAAWLQPAGATAPGRSSR